MYGHMMCTAISASDMYAPGFPHIFANFGKWGARGFPRAHIGFPRVAHRGASAIPRPPQPHCNARRCVYNDWAARVAPGAGSVLLAPGYLKTLME